MDFYEELRYWRFWPVFILAFFYPMNNSLINLAVPIYYFQEGYSTQIIGFIAAGSTYTYLFSPILLDKVSQRIKRRTSIIGSLVGVFLVEIIFYITLQPIPFLISRIIEGFFMGLYWPNLQSSISDNIFHEHSKLTAKYNISWNSGILCGFLLGAVILFVFRALLLIFYVAPLLIFINLIVAATAFQEPKKINKHSKEFQRYLKEKESLTLAQAVKIKQERDDFMKISFSVVYPILLIISYCITRATINFLYPIKSELLNFEAYSVYIASFFFALSQIISMIIASLMKLKFFKIIPILSLIITVIMVPILGLNTNYWIFLILFFIIGFCTGILYGVSLRLLLMLNIKKNTSRYSAFLESLIGFGFLIAPIIAGFIAEINLELTFTLLDGVLLLSTITLLFLAIKKVKISV
ncbi:MAG: MFS transporter [Candidatus Lokiarchaeota archaeon]|nr:MFS transporter [Candidatus Lokiarchaeota archaeon]MBD3201307.1 MFS transporter [Candidatus Lokiarchaeota archaeon]